MSFRANELCEIISNSYQDDQYYTEHLAIEEVCANANVPPNNMSALSLASHRPGELGDCARWLFDELNDHEKWRDKK